MLKTAYLQWMFGNKRLKNIVLSVLPIMWAAPAFSLCFTPFLLNMTKNNLFRVKVFQ